jgi:uncharacterized cupin superfamily protein
VGIAHFDEAPSTEFDIGHLRGRWTLLGEAAGAAGIGLRRIQVPAGGWSTPAHEHGAEEEIFYVLSGRGLSWQKGATAAVGAGDCIVYLAGRGAHTLHALEDLDVLAFGPRIRQPSTGFPRLDLSLIGNRAAESVAGAVDGAPIQFVREAALGPPELPEQPEPEDRPKTIVNLADVKAEPFGRGRVSAMRRKLGARAGASATGLQHVEVAPGKWGTPLHCHSLEEELFVVLNGHGTAVIGEEEIPVSPGSVVSRPPATGVAHAFRAGDDPLVYLAYGTREPGDECYYPHSNKIAFRGLGLIARFERLDYWDGED